MRRGNSSLVLPLASLLLTTPSHAAPAGTGALRLEWSAPGGCPNAVETRARIEALLGAKVEDLRQEPFIARAVVIEVDPQRFRLELETLQGEQRFLRTMEAPSCAELTDAGALVLALAIDPTLAERHAARSSPPAPPDPIAAPSSAPATTAPAPPPPSPIRDAPAPLARSEKSPPNLDFSLRLGVLSDLGTVSDVGFGARAGFGAALGLVQLELAATWLPPRRSFTAGNPSKGGDIDLVAGDLFGCLVPWRGALEARACALIEVGRLHGVGFGAERTTSGALGWFAVGAGGTLSWATTESLRLHAGFEALMSPQAVEFTLENVGLVHRVPNVVGRLGLGLETHFE